MKDLFLLLGRCCISALFLASGFKKVIDYGGTYDRMQEVGMSMATDFWLVGAILLLCLGGFSVLLGYKTKLGAGALLLFLIPATVIFHADWSDPLERIQLTKNIAIAGGLFSLMASGAGRYCIKN